MQEFWTTHQNKGLMIYKTTRKTCAAKLSRKHLWTGQHVKKRVLNENIWFQSIGIPSPMGDSQSSEIFVSRAANIFVRFDFFPINIYICSQLRFKNHLQLKFDLLTGGCNAQWGGIRFTRSLCFFFILRSILEIFEILAGFLSSMIPSTILHQKVPSSNAEFLFTF